MNQKFYALGLGLSVLALNAAQAQDAQRQGKSLIPHRTCAAVEVLNNQIAADPGLAQARAAIERQTANYAANVANTAQRGTAAITVTIPVVVHVVYGSTAENISDAQIASQIATLNEDYHLLNTDAGSVPSAFAGLKADVGIQFVLAKRTPSGLATTGIDRKSQATPTGGWGTADKIKQTTYGGVAAWDASKYLNFWVGTIGGGILGYAQFPGGSASTDGVVISSTYFGRTGSVTAPYNLGRTASHEVGHWLNLNHIWGDDGGACTGTDNVSDTPNQGAENYGKPVYPHVSCSNGPNGDMFMNYMDYVDDNAMFMFSTGQSSRMNALFATGGARVGLLTSQGGVAPGGTTTPPPTTVAYCASKGSSVAYEYLKLVQLGSINRSSGADGSYYNGTGTSTSVVAGSSQTLSFAAGFVSSAYSEYVKAYADWNQDGDFIDAGETIVSAAASTSASTRTAGFTVPATAKNGTTRLRIVLSDNSATTSCGSYSYGETEDYSITVSGGTARVAARLTASNAISIYPNPATTVLNLVPAASADADTRLTVRVSDLSGVEMRGTALNGNALDVAALPRGTYVLTVTDGKTVSHQRFVKE